jgi:hypothetical protein
MTPTVVTKKESKDISAEMLHRNKFWQPFLNSVLSIANNTKTAAEEQETQTELAIYALVATVLGILGAGFVTYALDYFILRHRRKTPSSSEKSVSKTSPPMDDSEEEEQNLSSEQIKCPKTPPKPIIKRGSVSVAFAADLREEEAMDAELLSQQLEQAERIQERLELEIIELRRGTSGPTSLGSNGQQGGQRSVYERPYSREGAGHLETFRSQQQQQQLPRY